jgi:hypothetical protein
MSHDGRFSLNGCHKEVITVNKQTLYCAAGTAILSLLLAAMVAPAVASHDGPYATPEYVFYIEGTGTYILSDPEVDIFFNLGRWYRRSGGSWSVSLGFNGPWGSIAVNSVPSVLVGLPVDFRATHQFSRVPYKYIRGSGKIHDDNGRYYYSDRYDDDHHRSRYERHWHPEGGFWFFFAPDRDHEDRDDSYRRRRRGRGRGKD